MKKKYINNGFRCAPLTRELFDQGDIAEMSIYKSTNIILHEIYNKHRRNYPENGDSKRMCRMWSTDDPPDVIEGTEPFNDIEAAFDMSTDEGDALDLYDMYLEEATKRILEIQQRN